MRGDSLVESERGSVLDALELLLAGPLGDVGTVGEDAVHREPEAVPEVGAEACPFGSAGRRVTVLQTPASPTDRRRSGGGGGLRSNTTRRGGVPPGAGGVLEEPGAELDVPRGSSFGVERGRVATIVGPRVQVVAPSEKFVLGHLAVASRVELGASKVDRIVRQVLGLRSVQIDQRAPAVLPLTLWKVRTGLEAGHACALHESGANLFQSSREKVG